MTRNLSKVKQLAKNAQVSTVILTGKGEPCLNLEKVLFFASEFRDYIVELQTNGLFLQKQLEFVRWLATAGVDIISVSLDKLEPSYLFYHIREADMTSRVTLNVTDMLHPDINFSDILHFIKNIVQADQLLLRNVTIPNGFDTKARYHKEAEWVLKHGGNELYKKLASQMADAISARGHFLRTTEFHSKIFDLDGISVTTSDYCIQDHNDSYDIKNLIFLDDGHVYTSWASKASRLF